MGLVAMRNYNSPAIPFPDYVADGTVKVTPTEPGKALISLGRRSARGGVKHLGVLNRLEALAVYVALNENFDLEGLLEATKQAHGKTA
jgi:hypothetical protein